MKLPKSEWIVVPDMHEPIIDGDLWNAVQNLLKSRQGNDKQFKSESEEINPLRGIVHCRECCSGMWRMSYQSGENRYKYYRCRTVKNSEGICDNINSIRQTDLEDLILKELRKLSDTYFDETQIRLQTKPNNRLSAMEEERKQLEKKIAKIQNNSVQLYKDKLSGLINDSQFKILNDNFNSEVNQHNKRLELIEKEMERLSGEKQNTLSREAILSKYKNTEKLTFELVHELIEGVYVGKINPETKEREIEIHWKF